jgi:transposase
MIVPSRPAADADPAGTIYAAVELSQRGWLVAVQVPGNGRASRHKLSYGDVAGLLGLIERIRAKEERATGRPVRAACCHEAGYDGFWLHRRLEAAGVASHVLDPASLQVDRRARRVKTDAIDAEALLRALTAYCRGEAGACRMVRVPSVEEEDAKRLHRERRRLIKGHVAHVNRIKALLATQGISDYQPLKADRRARVDELRTAEGRALPPHLRREILRELDRLGLVLDQVRAVEAERDAVARADRPAGAGERMIWDLARLRGVGPETATVLVREALDRGFANRRQVAAYAGLTPRARTAAAACSMTRASARRATRSCARP